MLISRQRLFALFVGLMLAPCGWAQAANPAQTQIQPPPGAESPGPDYIIGPGDTLRVFVLGNPDLTSEVLVRPDGRISTPLVNDMVAVGKTPTQLGTDIANVLQEFVRLPTVSVIVSRPTSTFSQVRVVGQAANPRAVAYRSGMTILDVVIEVGGLSQFAAGNRAELIRTLPGGQVKKLRVRLNDLMNRGDMKHNLPVQAGDVLLIPEARF